MNSKSYSEPTCLRAGLVQNMLLTFNKMQILSKAEIVKQLKSISSHWLIKENALHREFVFTHFKEAFAFMTSVAELAETLNHHPDWCNSNKTVNISITTHDIGGLSEKDFKLAGKIDFIFKNSKK
jgi:4a-hydroxytetrahydrobiopterin dehydratase